MEYLWSCLLPSDLIGHAAYVLIAVSYLVTSMLWLRILAIAGLLFEVIYFWLSGGNLWAGISWGLLFIAINLVQVVILMRHRMHARRRGAELGEFSSIVAGLPPEQVSKLLKAGRKVRYDWGAPLTVEGEAVSDLFLICEGDCAVIVGDRAIDYVGPGDFAGDVSFATGSHAEASIVSMGGVTAFAFDVGRLKKLLASEPDIGMAIYRQIGVARCAARLGPSADRSHDHDIGVDLAKELERALVAAA